MALYASTRQPWMYGTAPAPSLGDRGLTSGLVGAWQFAGGKLCELRSGSKLTLVGGGSIATKRSGVRSLTGLVSASNGARANMALPVRLQLPLPITMVWWGGRADGNAPANGALIWAITTNGDGTTDAFTWWFDSGVYKMAVGASFNNAGPAPAVNDQMIAIRVANGAIDWFVNGRFSTSTAPALSNPSYSAGANLTFGDVSNPSVIHHQALLYNRKLGTPEIRALWNEPYSWLTGTRGWANGTEALAVLGVPSTSTHLSPFLVGCTT